MISQTNSQDPRELALHSPDELPRSGIEPPHPATRAGFGALAGAVATMPMTVAMGAIHSRISDGFWRPPPPYEVTVEMADELGIDKNLTLRDRLLLTMLSHFGYGAAAGAAYGLSAARAPLPPAVKGIAFGCAVWAGSYLGWLPAAGFRAAAPHQSRQRNAMTLAAHVVWGCTLGVAYAKWMSGRRSSFRSSAAPREAEIPGSSRICGSSSDRSQGGWGTISPAGREHSEPRHRPDD